MSINPLPALTQAVRELREGYPGVSERELAERWRAQLRDRLLDDHDSFTMISSAVIALLGSELLQKCDIDDPELIDHAPPLFTGRPDLFTSIIGSVRAIRQWRVARPLTPGVLAELTTLCLAAQALTAPDELWATIAPDSAPSVPSALGNPNRALSLLVGAELRLSAGVAQAENRVVAMKAATGQIEATLRDGILDTFVRDQLASVGIETDSMRALLARKRQYDAAGPMKRMLMGPVSDLVKEEAGALIQRWEKVRVGAQATLDERRRLRAAELDKLSGLGTPFQPGPDSQLPEVLRQQPGYIGDRLADFGAPHANEEVLPRTLWTVHALPDREWARLPMLDYQNQSSVVFVTDRRELPPADARRAAVSIVLDQMSRALPGRLRLTWIDPQANSAGPLLELLEASSETRDIDAALRGVSTRLSELEQRCRKDTYPDLDAYNVRHPAEPHHVVVVNGYPLGFTEDSARRLRMITEAGGRTGISVLVVTDPSMRSVFTLSNKEKPFPTVSPELRGTSWWHPSLLPVGRLVFGHAGQPHAQVQADIDGETVLVPCRFLEFTPTEAANIVSGYTRYALPPAP